ncbi:hypothetical protein VTH06DRAFT_2746 [Thermothelomyces fergusii]
MRKTNPAPKQSFSPAEVRPASPDFGNGVSDSRSPRDLELPPELPPPLSSFIGTEVCIAAGTKGISRRNSV